MSRKRPGAISQAEGFLLVRLEGDPYEIGVQHGALLADRIVAMRRTLYNGLIFRQGRLLGIAFLALARVLLAIMERHVPAELKLEMRGVAAGAGVPYRDILFFNCFDDLLHSLVRLALAVPAPARARLGMACSCFVALGDRTAGGTMLLGRNLDYYLEGGILGADGLVTRTMREHLVCYVIRPAGGHAFISIGWPGCVGVVTGLNRTGLAVACLTSALPGQTPNGTPLLLLYRSIIQRCADLAQVEATLRTSRRTVGNNLVVASTTDRNAALFEFTPRVVRRIAPDGGQIVATNHFQNRDLAADQTNWVIPNSVHRLERLSALCRDQDLRLDLAEGYLTDSVLPRRPDGEAFSCLHNLGTIYSVVLAPEELRAWIRATDTPDRAFAEVDVGVELGERTPTEVA